MNETTVIKPEAQARRMTRDDLPKRGDWHWVTYRNWSKKQVTSLMCVETVASNHIEFTGPTDDGGTTSVRVRFHELEVDTKSEPNWKQVLAKQIDEKKNEIQQAVASLADMMKSADILPDETVQAAPTLLPSTTRRSPEETKKNLIKLRDKKLPEAHKDIERLTKEMVALNRALYLPELNEADRLKKAAQGIEDRLFVLELYAGMWQNIEQLTDGKPASATTPITVRQMLRYMDEETLFDLDSGGMDYKNLSDFDNWVCKPENLHRVCPEDRCIVAFKVRRKWKNYPNPSDIFGWFEQMRKHEANMKTYLLMRNGEQVFRLACEIEFEPRLLPMSTEFNQAFMEEHREWGVLQRKEERTESNWAGRPSTMTAT
jgi:hypothetical protein